jgi:hypothetical protein
VLPRGLRVGEVTGSPGAFKLRPHAELSSLDVVSVLYFDTPALTRADPPAVAAEHPLSAPPEESQEPSIPTASSEPLPPSSSITQTGTGDGASPSEGVAQVQP